MEYAQCSLQYALPNASKSMHIHNASTHNAECTGCPNAKAGASQASQYDRCRPPATNLAVGTFPFFCTVIKSQHQCRIRPCRYYSWYKRNCHWQKVSVFACVCVSKPALLEANSLTWATCIVHLVVAACIVQCMDREKSAGDENLE